MKEKKSSEKTETAAQAEPLTQILTIKDAVTYIVDEQGNEVKQESESSKQKAESSDQ